jgi:hypothetical protein
VPTKCQVDDDIPRRKFADVTQRVWEVRSRSVPAVRIDRVEPVADVLRNVGGRTWPEPDLDERRGAFYRVPADNNPQRSIHTYISSRNEEFPAPSTSIVVESRSIVIRDSRTHVTTCVSSVEYVAVQSGGLTNKYGRITSGIAEATRL